MQIVPNWKAAQILELAGPVKSVWQQSDFADLSNRHICGRWVADEIVTGNKLNLEGDQ